MENFVIKYLSQIFDFSRNFLYIASLKQAGISDAIKSKGFSAQYSMFAILFGGIAIYFHMNYLIGGIHVQKAIGSALFQVILGSIIGFISLLLSGKITGVNVQSAKAWRFSIIFSATGTTLNGIVLLTQLGIIQLFHLYWDAIAHTGRSLNYYDLVNALLFFIFIVYFLIFAFTSIRAFCDVNNIRKIWKYTGAWIVISLAITVLSIPLLFLSYSILGIPIEELALALEDFTYGPCCSD